MFDIPEDITALDLDALREAIDNAVSEAASIEGEPEDLTAEQAEQLTKLADFVQTARAEVKTRETALAEQQEKIAAARDALKEPEPESEPEPNEPEASAAAAAENETAPADDADEPAAGTEQEKEKESVAASGAGGGRRKVVAAASKSAPPVEAPEPPVVSLVASAEVPGHATGTQFADMKDLSKSMLAKLSAMPKHRIGGEAGTRIRHSVATIEKGSVRTDGLTQKDFHNDDMSLIAATKNEARLPGGSLTAAGGWCAPSETLYDVCTTATTDGLLDIPEFQVTRGGIRYTSGPDFSSIFEQIADMCMTEQDVIDGQLKDCIEVDCPEFEQIRMDVCWLCIRVPLLTQNGYPEYVQAYIDTALIANAHKMSARDVQKILDGSIPVNADGSYGNAIDPLAELELVAMYQRQKFALASNQTLEILLPYWFRTVIRADLARRTGVEAWNVTDAQIESYFSNRMLRVQWLRYMYPIASDQTTETDEDGNEIVTAEDISIPATIDVPMFPAGTWQRGTTDVISLDAVYDSQGLAENTYTALFVEEGNLLLEAACNESVKVTIPTCATGETGAADLTECVLAGTAS